MIVGCWWVDGCGHVFPKQIQTCGDTALLVWCGEVWSVVVVGEIALIYCLYDVVTSCGCGCCQVCGGPQRDQIWE